MIKENILFRKLYFITKVFFQLFDIFHRRRNAPLGQDNDRIKCAPSTYFVILFFHHPQIIFRLA